MNENEEVPVVDIPDDSGPSVIKTLGIPVLNRGDLLLRCILSIDSPIENLFIINNGEDRSVADAVARIQRKDIPNAGMFGDIRVEKFRNLGCAKSWNHIIRTSPGAWLISGNDIQFSPGDVERIKEVLSQNQDASIICAMAYAVYCFTDIGVRKVGMFDENFYPAYFEDNDHSRRVALSNAKAVSVPGFKAIHGEAPNWGSCTINSNPTLQRKNAITFRNLRDYYIEKWGGEPGKEKFITPYNRGVSLDFCEVDPDLREKNSIF
jgi:GT2 family glycosyltransferase